MNEDIEYNTENLKAYVKFYNLRFEDYKSVRININEQKLSNFLKKHNIIRLDFYVASFSLYLSRVDKTKGCLFKTANSENEQILLKTDYIKENLFTDYLNKIETIQNFTNDISFYSIYETTANDNLNFNGDALSLNIYDDYLNLVYNDDLFSDIYIQHMAANIETLINNVLDNPNQRICDVDILSDWDKELLEEFCYGKYDEFEKDKTLAMAFR